MKHFFLSAVIFISMPVLSDEIKIAGPKNLSYLAMAAREDKSFDPLGIQFSYTPVLTGKLAMDALTAKEVDFAFLVDSNIAYAGFEQSDLKILAAVATRLDDGLAYLPNKNISSPHDLKGKRIGYIPATTSHVYLWRLLNSVGLTLRDVKPIVLQPPSMLSALQGNTVDAVSIWNPWRETIKKSLKETVAEIRSTEALYPSRTLLVTRADVLDKHRPLAVTVLRVFQAVHVRIVARPSKYMRLFTEELSIDDESFATMWSGTKLAIVLDTSLITLLHQLGTWVKESREDLKDVSIPDYSSMIDKSVLTEVDPSAVSD